MSEKFKKRLPIIAFAMGVVALVVGIELFVFKSVSEPSMADAEFLTSIGKWVREDTSNVVWDFTEMGKGSLTTDNYATTYDFIWAIEDGKLKIETKWLYDLDNEFEYTIDQKAKTLSIKSAEKATKINFKAL